MMICKHKKALVKNFCKIAGYFCTDVQEATCEHKEMVTSLQTNADRIRSMSDEELAELINQIDICDLRTHDECRMIYAAHCDSCVLDWLQQPVGECE